jgi:H+-transporting ATPase
MGVTVKMVTGDALAIAQDNAKMPGLGANILDATKLGDEAHQGSAAASALIGKSDVLL